MLDQNIMDEPHPGPANVAGGGFTLAEAMLNKKSLVKARADISNMKAILSEMQMDVVKHDTKIATQLVTEEHLKVALELQENEFKHSLSTKLDQMYERVKPKIKKRLKVSEYKNYLTSKVNQDVFNKNV